MRRSRRRNRRSRRRRSWHTRLELESRENSCKTIFATGTCGVFRIKRGPLDTVGIGFVGGKIHLALQKLEKQPSFFISPKRLLVPTPPRLCTVQFNSRPVSTACAAQHKKRRASIVDGGSRPLAALRGVGRFIVASRLPIPGKTVGRTGGAIFGFISHYK